MTKDEIIQVVFHLLELVQWTLIWMMGRTLAKTTKGD